MEEVETQFEIFIVPKSISLSFEDLDQPVLLFSPSRGPVEIL